MTQKLGATAPQILQESGGSSISLPPPIELKALHQVGDALQQQVSRHQESIRQIVSVEDKRLLVITGPCSLHCSDAAIEYARRLANLQQQVEGQCLLVMRAYLEKPRTSLGWKGLLYDPDLNGGSGLEEGLKQSRQLLIRLLETGVPLATEILNPLAYPYLDDLISWVAIGARTTESQIHRELASGLSCPVGFKNGTDGSLGAAINALRAAASPHCYLGSSPEGSIAMCQSSGNPYGQLVLRGGKSGVNYTPKSVLEAEEAMREAGIHPSMVVDCSHENSGKDHRQQGKALKSVAEQVAMGNQSLRGVMLESHLRAGRQAISESLEYGMSITDACIDWAETESLIQELGSAVSTQLMRRKAG